MMHSLRRSAARCRTALAAAALLAAPLAGAGTLNLSGFATVTVGSILDGSYTGTLNDYQCPCFIANYEYAGLYEDDDWSANVDSTVGVQADVRFTDTTSVTVQLDAHGPADFKPAIDWAYASYRATDNWTLQAGTKRLPLYYYSDSNYIGYSYPWVRPPVDVYGWEIYSYDGVNAIYANTFGDWAVRSNVWAGRQSDNDSAMMGRIYNGERTRVVWDDILGGAVDLGNDIVSLRLIYMQSDLRQTLFPDDGSAAVEQYPGDTTQQIYGAAFNVDYGNFLWRSEYNTFIRKQLVQTAPSFFASAGWRHRDLTFLYTYSQYREEYEDNYTEPQRYNTRSGTVRWDFRRKMALKAQVDRFRDESTVLFLGDSTLATLSLTTIF